MASKGVINMTLAMLAGTKLRSLIESRNLTQDEASILIGVEERTLRRYLKDGIDKISILEHIAKVFNVDLVATFLTE